MGNKLRQTAENEYWATTCRDSLDSLVIECTLNLKLTGVLGENVGNEFIYGMMGLVEPCDKLYAKHF